MNAAELERELISWRLTQSEFAQLVGVSPRTVRMWLEQDREKIPGPVVAYLRLLKAAPQNVREQEFEIARGKTIMISGFYGVKLSGIADVGSAVLVLSNGKIVGVDEGRVSYDGLYVFDPSKNSVRCAIRVTVPPRTWQVQGVTSGVGEYYDVVVDFPANAQAFSGVVQTPHGPVHYEVSLLRSLPNLAAA